MPNQAKYTSKLTDQRALIFGSTSGIGYAVAEAALEHGAYVILNGSSQFRLESTIHRLRTSYPDVSSDRISAFPCDLSDKENLESNLDALFKQAVGPSNQKINHIVFTAGDAWGAAAPSEYTVDSILSMGTVRVLAPLIIAKLLPTYMTLSPNNSLTVTGGTNTDRPFKHRALWAVWGAAMEGGMRGLAVDLAPLRVNLVSPGAIETELWKGMGMGEEAYRGFVEGRRRDTLVGEVGRPEDVAEAYLWVMRDRFVTGEVVRCNGGRLLVGGP